MAAEAVAQPSHESDDAQNDRQRFEDLARDPAKREAALELGEKIAKSLSDNPQGLNNFAWDLLTNDHYRNQFDRYALLMARKACEQTDHNDWALLDTLALANYRAGKIDDAIKLQKKAVALQGGSNSELNEALARYEANKNGL